MRFQAIAINDLDGIKDLQPEGWPDIIPEFELYIKRDYCVPIKTVSDGNIVGIGAAIIFGRTGWLAHIIVHKNYRNRGIGLSIVNELLRITKSRSVETCLLIASDLGLPVYKKVGFESVCEYLFFKREKPWKSYAVSTHIEKYRDEYYSMITAIDRKISGEDREILIREYIKDSIVYRDNEIIKGYYMPELGGGLIYADTDTAGLELMKIKYSTADTAVLPSENTAGIKFLEQNGFTPVSRGARMILGKQIIWSPEKVFSRIAGNLG